ncbi:phage shock protein operon transcriptional activator [Halieaceae bacterium IMCC14734]|uniref:Phage shock protein operon transcriptional activator n=1 Tax=Candidatus Litorirhabdus singularis TaxID=2518993 RepID=A0ABT3TJN6_9GAMM|nr:phage shock protein operon transcriptional activator [Candidatus Litorirhabdus singularis]MCX2981587.1 phage shock protein operon transcriptional activator [Candidatus Litorirhabdus singularis]
MPREQEHMVGNSIALNDTLEHVSRVAPINRPVLVVGERGTGKELIGERLHYLSTRWEGPLVKVNCAAIAEPLLESELFGHEPGAFTGATRTHQGRFERADGGTLFLDELGTMSSGLQEKLLRLVEYGEFERLGGQTTLQVDVRVVAATNADLQRLAAAGEFREDLLDRLSFDVIHLPPLRHRQSDIPELAHHFAVQMCSELGWDLFPGFTNEAALALLRHPWPGNVRELKNAVERSVYRWETPEQPLDTVVLDPFYNPWQDPPLEPADNERDTSITLPPAQPVRATTPATPDFGAAVRRHERGLLSNALQQHQHHQGDTARALGLSYDQLRGLLRKHGLTGATRNPQPS